MKKAQIKVRPSNDWSSHTPLITKVPFVRFDPADWTPPSYKAKTRLTYKLVDELYLVLPRFVKKYQIL